MTGFLVPSRSATPAGQRLSATRAGRGLLAALITVIMAAFAVGPVNAADSVYTISNYPVEATDKNAVVAKEKALADGQRAAFRSLLKRIVPVTAYKQISRLKDVNAADLVSGMSVRSERNSATRYIASLDFSFQADAVRSVLTREGVPFVDQQAENVLVVPVIKKGSDGKPENDTGIWRRVWGSLDLNNTLTPVTLSDLKTVIHPDTVDMLVRGDGGGLRILANEYQSSRVVLAIAEPDLAAKIMTVTLAGQDAVGPINLKRIYRLSDGDVQYASELAAVVSLGVLEGRWKAVKAPPASPFATSGVAQGAATPWGNPAPAWAATSTGRGEMVRLVAEFSTAAQWTDIRTKLLNTPGVEALEISTVTAANADLSLLFPGGAQGLAAAVGSKGLSLGNGARGLVLRTIY